MYVSLSFFFFFFLPVWLWNYQKSTLITFYSFAMIGAVVAFLLNYRLQHYKAHSFRGVMKAIFNCTWEAGHYYFIIPAPVLERREWKPEHVSLWDLTFPGAEVNSGLNDKNLGLQPFGIVSQSFPSSAINLTYPQHCKSGNPEVSYLRLFTGGWLYIYTYKWDTVAHKLFS